MKQKNSKSELLYEAIKQALLTGQYTPGARIDPSRLAQEFNISPTPVRFALYRLVGEGVIEDHAREGFHVPRVTEMSLRELYDWMERLLLIACETQLDHLDEKSTLLDALANERDIVSMTAHLFEAIALRTDNSCLYFSVRRTNSLLSPIRHMKAGILEGTDEELCILRDHWVKQRVEPLKAAVIDYHQRRKDLVPRIVATVNRPLNFQRKK